jgi:uncharacterized protein YgiM (DUF1202 family)
MFKPGDHVRIMQEYHIQYVDPIEVTAGDKVMVELEDVEFPGWVWCRTADGRQGWVPIELLLKQDSGEAIVRQTYSARELAVQPGEDVVIVDSRHGWLQIRNSAGECGWVPEFSVESRQA